MDQEEYKQKKEIQKRKENRKIWDGRKKDEIRQKLLQSKQRIKLLDREDERIEDEDK